MSEQLARNIPTDQLAREPAFFDWSIIKDRDPFAYPNPAWLLPRVSPWMELAQRLDLEGQSASSCAANFMDRSIVTVGSSHDSLYFLVTSGTTDATQVASCGTAGLIGAYASSCSTAAQLFAGVALRPIANIAERHPWVAAACASAVSGNFRAAYRLLYRGLDFLFMGAHWDEVAEVLDEVCSDRYPADLGIGVMRFSSDAAPRIPGWNARLVGLTRVAAIQGLDVAIAFRGLLGE